MLRKTSSLCRDMRMDHSLRTSAFNLAFPHSKKHISRIYYINIQEKQNIETKRVDTEDDRLALMDEYNRMMHEKMGWDELDPFTYHPERGLYYHYIETDMLVGSQPQTAEDVKYLAEQEGVSVILSLQQKKDLEYWGVDGDELLRAASNHGLEYMKVEAVDFDPNSLRGILPKAVASLERARSVHGKTYIHCTAGLGRAPAVAIASLFWSKDMSLDDAYDYLTRIRPCGPNADAIRGATFDILDHRGWEEFQHLPHDAFRYLSQSDRDVIKQKLFDHLN